MHNLVYAYYYIFVRLEFDILISYNYIYLPELWKLAELKYLFLHVHEIPSLPNTPLRIFLLSECIVDLNECTVRDRPVWLYLGEISTCNIQWDEKSIWTEENIYYLCISVKHIPMKLIIRQLYHLQTYSINRNVIFLTYILFICYK